MEFFATKIIIIIITDRSKLRESTYMSGRPPSGKQQAGFQFLIPLDLLSALGLQGARNKARKD